MGLTKPDISASEKFSDHFKEGELFFLTGIRTVKVATDYGEGDMVLLRIKGIDSELGIWGNYLTAQALAAEESDLNKWYTIVRGIVDGYSKREVKLMRPHDAPGNDEELPF